MDRVTSQKIHMNRSRRYILPCLKEYGDEFVKRIEAVFKIAVGLGDIIVRKKYERHIFVLMDTTIATRFFIEFLTWIKHQDMYEDDYVFGDMQKSTLHMVVLQFPEPFSHKLEQFWQGHYSKMFSKGEMRKYFSPGNEVIKVLTRDHDYRIAFTQRLNKIFGTSLSPEEYEGELDFRPEESEELFNHHLREHFNDIANGRD